MRPLLGLTLFFITMQLAAEPQLSRHERIARYIVAGEAYGQGLWYSGRLSYRFHENLLANAGYSFLEVPPADAGGKTAAFHVIPLSASALWQLPFTTWPIHAELLFGGNIVIGSDRTERTGVRATMTGQAFTPTIGFGVAFLQREGGLFVRATCYIFQGFDSVGMENRRLPWMGGTIGYAF